METGVWTTEKPNEECVFVTAKKWRNSFVIHGIWEIRLTEGVDEFDNECMVLSLLDSEGEKWGDLSDLLADLYYVLPTPQPIEGEKVWVIERNWKGNFNAIEVLKSEADKTNIKQHKTKDDCEKTIIGIF